MIRCQVVMNDLQDALWHSLHEQCKLQRNEIIKACTSNPVELRSEAIAARAAVMRQPNSYNSEYLVKLMG